MATINDLLLQRDGVLRFIMEGERINGELPVFSREQLLVDSQQKLKAVVDQVSSDSKDKTHTTENRIITSLRAELKHGHGTYTTYHLFLIAVLISSSKLCHSHKRKLSPPLSSTSCGGRVKAETASRVC